ncbi:MAG: nucleotidyltransferase domain-containing protein [Deltaproteobacteria bacterium]|jgi:predicted nucleotidyltransferase|nr:nucleotidyltransferase domain-containing protein [Deltaproteobacteria bacterium]
MINLSIVKKVVSQLAEEYPIKNLTCFGSYADGVQTENSDIDFLVEFLTPSVSLIMLSGLKQRLEEQLFLSVDLIHAPIPTESLITINNKVLIYERA